MQNDIRYLCTDQSDVVHKGIDPNAISKGLLENFLFGDNVNSSCQIFTSTSSELVSSTTNYSLPC